MKIEGKTKLALPDDSLRRLLEKTPPPLPLLSIFFSRGAVWSCHQVKLASGWNELNIQAGKNITFVYCTKIWVGANKNHHSTFHLFSPTYLGPNILVYITYNNIVINSRKINTFSKNTYVCFIIYVLVTSRNSRWGKI